MNLRVVSFWIGMAFTVIMITAIWGGPPARALEIGHSQNLILEIGTQGPVIVFEKIVTIQFGAWTLGGISGPEFIARSQSLTWRHDVFLAKDHYTLGINWSSKGEASAYAMYTF